MIPQILIDTWRFLVMPQDNYEPDVVIHDCGICRKKTGTEITCEFCGSVLCAECVDNCMACGKVVCEPCTLRGGSILMSGLLCPGCDEICGPEREAKANDVVQLPSDRTGELMGRRKRRRKKNKNKANRIAQQQAQANREAATEAHEPVGFQPPAKSNAKPVTRKFVSNAPLARKLVFSPTAWAKLVYMRDKGHTEISGFGIAHDKDELLYVNEFRTVKQDASAAAFEFEDESLNEYLDQMVDEGFEPCQCMRIWIHTHPGDGCTPSGTDHNTFREKFGECDWALMVIVGKSGNCHAQLRFNVGPRADLLLPVERDYKSPFAGTDHDAWEDEYNANVKRSFQHYNQGGSHVVFVKGRRVVTGNHHCQSPDYAGGGNNYQYGRRVVQGQVVGGPHDGAEIADKDAEALLWYEGYGFAGGGITSGHRGQPSNIEHKKDEEKDIPKIEGPISHRAELASGSVGKDGIIVMDPPEKIHAAPTGDPWVEAEAKRIAKADADAAARAEAEKELLADEETQLTEGGDVAADDSGEPQASEGTKIVVASGPTKGAEDVPVPTHTDEQPLKGP